jgi:hypothetical protein
MSLSSTRPSLDRYSPCRHDAHRGPHRGPRSAGGYRLQPCWARCWYVPLVRHTIEATPKRFELLGSIAAGIQSGIGNVAAGSLFALAQSLAMR